MFLHEHEPNFSGSIATTRKVFDVMSFCDSISTDWEARLIGQDFVSQVSGLSYLSLLQHNYLLQTINEAYYPRKLLF